jgi:DNA-binding CsgD family transcriptional regulator
MDIAKALDISVHTVKSHLKRSLSVLRQRCFAMRAVGNEELGNE